MKSQKLGTTLNFQEATRHSGTGFKNFINIFFQMKLACFVVQVLSKKVESNLLLSL